MVGRRYRQKQAKVAKPRSAAAITRSRRTAKWNIGRSWHFYDAAPRPLGLVRIVDFGNGRGSDYGAAPGSLGVEFTITHEPELRTPIAGAHLCFRAPDRRAVRAVSHRGDGGRRQR